MVVAFSTYSKIPMPNIKIKEKDDRFSLCFFPLVGVIIAVVEYVWFLFGWYYGFEEVPLAIGYLIIPVAITGGIHVDGFMDCMDALHSYADREKKQEILKDPHIGAFCVIKLVELIGVMLIMLLIIQDYLFLLVCPGFVMSRILSAISINCFKSAKDSGMVCYTKSRASGFCKWFLFVEFVACVLFCFYHYQLIAIWPITAILISFVIYYVKVKHDFGGITGDTSGCFLVMAEAAWMLAIALYGLESII